VSFIGDNPDVAVRILRHSAYKTDVTTSCQIHWKKPAIFIYRKPVIDADPHPAIMILQQRGYLLPR
jgi:hypothetical protein